MILVRPSRGGLSLVEVVVSTLLVGVLMTAALHSVGASARSASAANTATDAMLLAKQLVEEIVSQPYEDPDQPPNFGCESGESGDSSTRTQLDDIDDYKDWIDTPPKLPDGTLIDGFAGWQRACDIQKINTISYADVDDSGIDTGLRLITVRVTAPSGRSYTVKRLRSKPGGTKVAQGVARQAITNVGVTLQSGLGTAITSSVSPLNQVGEQ